MLHWRGNGVDVEALHDRIPLRQDAGKGPKMGSHGYRRLRQWKSGFVAPLDGFWGIRVYIGGRSRSGGLRGAHKVGGHALPPWARLAPYWPPRGSSELHSKSPGCLLVQEKSSRKFYSVWYSFSAKL